MPLSGFLSASWAMDLLYCSICCKKWKAPIILPISVRAMPGIPSSAAARIKSWVDAVDCKMENWEWAWQWTKGWSAKTARSDSECGLLTAPACVLASCLKALDASFKLRCSNLIGWINSVFFNKNWSKNSELNWVNSSAKYLRRTNSKKHRVVATTSAVALWAWSKSLSNKNWCNSVKVGNLYRPPLPPGIWHNWAVTSVQVSSIW